MRRFVLSLSAVLAASIVALASPANASGDICRVPVTPPPAPNKIISFHAGDVSLFREVAASIGASDMSGEYQRVIFRFNSPVSGTVHVQLGDSGLYSDLVNAMGREGFTLEYAAPGAYIEGETK